mmetsp:Transcript_25528/g.64900  ORF Transcript_25528/g.64900 Transcript_25528/m.64900 type:complete len:80 (-) Transcript_25528:240-479(-)
MIGVELDARHPPGTAKALTQACTERGLLLLSCSVFETIRFIPPLTVSRAEVEQAAEIFEAALAEVIGRMATRSLMDEAK